MATILSDTAIRNTKPREKCFKLSDTKGLFLLVHPNGGKYWRLKYRFDGKEGALALGVYPDISLADARRRRDEKRQLISQGFDPGAQKRIDKLTAKISRETTFAMLADELCERKVKEGKAAETLRKVRWLLDLACPVLGTRPITEIQPIEILAVLKKIEAAGHLETARRLRAVIGEVFRLAVQTARASIDPTSSLKGAIRAPRPQQRAAILDPVEFGGLLRVIDGYSSLVVRSAMQLLAILFQRPGEIRGACWNEFDLVKAVWEIPAFRMKMRRPHRVPLPRQALEILTNLHAYTGDGELLFPGLRGKGKPISENTLNAALRRMGYNKNEVVSHGFRATASSLLNESGEFVPDVIEAALAHVDQNAVRRAYNRSDFWAERQRMGQWWADYLDGLREGGKLRAFHAG